MAIKLNLTDPQKDQLIEFYRGEIKKIESQKKQYIDLINQIAGDQSRSTAKNQLTIISSTPKAYESTWSWSLKAQYILENERKYLTVREILEKIILIEPSIKDNERDNYQYLSSTISTKVANQKTFGRHTSPDKRGALIGLLTWYKDGQPKPLSEI